MEKPKFQSPLLGYNTNVRHLGMVYHIQTEDSGVGHPHIITHLFVEGTILSTKKIGYKEHVGKADYEDIVRGMMRNQHKTMFIELRDGVHDPMSKQIFGDKLDLSEEHGAGQAAKPGTPSAAPAAPAPEKAPDSVPKSRVSGGVADGKSVRIVRPAAMSVQEKQEQESESEEQNQENLGRSIFDTPDEDGEFGESLISDKSLDEVILSYLTDELDE
ncbi:MAG: hypothetical protein GY762_14025 [Proteobacteria bacterium]|nr:hypothetical protein [Pseudomonadota bacterium]